MGGELVEQWREVGSALWLVAGGALLAWWALYGVLAAVTRPRRVEPGAATLDLGGPEPPAVVNLVTGDWELGPEAVPATLLDLAARRHLDVDQVGDRTLVRPAGTAGASGTDPLTGYERMVLDHVTALSRNTGDGVVPAEALTTGPGGHAKRWWRRFRDQVQDDARARGLSRIRWSPGHRLALVIGAALVAACAGLAASTLADEGDESDESNGGNEMDESPISSLIVVGGATFGALGTVVARMTGQRDTPAGRASAARWLGLREHLTDDTLFADQPPAAVAVWDRHLAYGVALGVAHGAVRALPLGAESDDVAWSPVGGRWRVVRVRYPRFLPPGYGWLPGLVLVVGLAHLAVAAAVGQVLLRLAGDLRDDELAGGPWPDVAAGMRLAIVAVTAARGAWMAYAGTADLVGGRRTVEGRVLRRRVRGGDDSTRWYVAVDDGTTDRIRAWWCRHAVDAPQGATVRAEVAPRLGHVRGLEVVAPAGPAREGRADERAVQPAGGQADERAVEPTSEARTADPQGRR